MRFCHPRVEHVLAVNLINRGAVLIIFQCYANERITKQIASNERSANQIAINERSTYQIASNQRFANQIAPIEMVQMVNQICRPF